MNNLELPLSTYYDLDHDDLEGYEEHFIFTNYYFDLEFALENNSKIKELLNYDNTLISTFSDSILDHLMTIIQLRPLIDTVISTIIDNLKNELKQLKIKARQALLGSILLKKSNSTYIQPAIVVDSIKMGFKLGPEEVKRACEQSLLQIINTH
jgi:hypothetical protein